jgi:cytochrome c
VVNKKHPSTKGLPEKWERSDEWYNYKSINPDLNVLAKLDEKSYEGGENDGNHPIIWHHNYDGGRAFYTGGGHTNESFADPVFMQHLLGGIRYSMGK